MKQVYVVIDEKEERESFLKTFRKTGLDYVFYRPFELLEEIDRGLIKPPRFIFVTNEIGMSPFTWLEKFTQIANKVTKGIHVFRANIYFVTTNYLEAFRKEQQSILATDYYKWQIKKIDTLGSSPLPIEIKEEELIRHIVYFNLYLSYYLQLRLNGEDISPYVFYDIYKKIKKYKLGNGGFYEGFSTAGFINEALDIENFLYSDDEKESIDLYEKGIDFSRDIEIDRFGKVYFLGTIKGKGFPSGLIKEALTELEAFISVKAREEDLSFKEVIDLLHKSFYYLFNKEENTMDISLFACFLDIKKHFISYVNFNMDLAFYTRGREEVKLEKANSIGKERFMDYKVKRMPYLAEDILLVLTDGFIKNTEYRDYRYFKQSLVLFIENNRNEKAKDLSKELLKTFLIPQDEEERTRRRFLSGIEDTSTNRNKLSFDLAESTRYDMGLLLCKF